jgi:CheY-like chemotaxis protein
MAAQLQDCGFDVVEAMNAADALTILERDGSIDAVVSDVQMPGGMDGVALVHRIAKSWPRIALLVASGAGVVTTSELPAGCRYLAKPYEARQLVATIRGMVVGYAF